MTGPLVICECFARDGLQHETVQVATDDKVALIDAMTEAGFPRIEATSYSHPKRVPGFSDASEVLAGIKRREPDLDIVAFQEVGLRDRRHLQVLERAAAGRLSPTSSS